MLDGDLPVNHAILGNLQDVFNLLPNLTAPKATSKDLAALNTAANASVGLSGGSSENTELARAMSLKTNDQHMAIYLSSLIRAITAFHDLIDNKLQNRRQQEDVEAKAEEDKKSRELGKEEKLMLNGTSEKADKDSKDAKGSDKDDKSKKKP